MGKAEESYLNLSNRQENDIKLSLENVTFSTRLDFQFLDQRENEKIIKVHYQFSCVCW